MFRGDTWTLFKKIGSVQRATAPKPRNKTFPRNLIISVLEKRETTIFAATSPESQVWFVSLEPSASPRKHAPPTLTMGMELPEMEHEPWTFPEKVEHYDPSFARRPRRRSAAPGIARSSEHPGLCRSAPADVQDGLRRPRTGRGLPGPSGHGRRPRLHPRADHFRGHEHRQDGAGRLPDDRCRPGADHHFHRAPSWPTACRRPSAASTTSTTPRSPTSSFTTGATTASTTRWRWNRISGTPSRSSARSWRNSIGRSRSARRG